MPFCKRVDAITVMRSGGLWCWVIGLSEPTKAGNWWLSLPSGNEYFVEAWYPSLPPCTLEVFFATEGYQWTIDECVEEGAKFTGPIPGPEVSDEAV